jgi:YHS domain-containing protein
MFIGGLIKLFYYAVLAYLAWTLYRFLSGAGRKRPARPAGKPRLSGRMVKDDVCGIYLPEENALRETCSGTERFFCSRECREKFLAEKKPERTVR